MKNNPFQKNNSKLTAKDILALSNKNKVTERAGEHQYVAPRNDREKQIHGFFEDLLGAQKIGVLDSFFQIGGNSLKATQLISQVHKQYKVELTLTEIFDHPKIEALTNFVENLLWEKQQVETDKVVDQIIL